MSIKNLHTIAIKQRGAVLVTALVLMSILSMIGIATMRSNTTDISIHKNMKSRSNAFQCAEAALRAGEIWVGNEMDSLPTEVTSGTPDQSLNQVYSWEAAEVQDLFGTNKTWWETHGWTYGVGMTDTAFDIGCGMEPRYIVERVGASDDETISREIEDKLKNAVDYFRITAYSVGLEDNAAVILQTTYAKRFR